MPTVQTFKDLSVTFKNTLSTMISLLSRIRQHCTIYQKSLLTNKGERPFQPELGCDIAKMLFEPLDYGSAAILKGEITNTIGRYEPRITIDNIICLPDEGNNGYEVELSYSIIGREDRPVTVEFFLERTR